MLVGESAAGKTRAAFEAMRAVLPDHLFIAPAGVEHVAAAAAKALGTGNCVLWLDDLELYLGSSGAPLRKAIVDVLAGAAHHRVVLATLSAIEEGRLTDGTDQDSWPLMRVSRAVLDQVTRRIFVSRVFSAAEQQRAADMADGDPRLAEAIRNADGHGICEYLARGPQLYAEWEDAWARGNHPRGAALVAAAVDCRRAGFMAPLPRPLLDELHVRYLDERGGADLYPEPPDQAWAWATLFRNSGRAPLRPVDPDRYEVFGYFIDELQRRTHSEQLMPEGTAVAALRYAGPADAGSIAAAAWHQGRYQLAESAINRAYQTLTEGSGSTDPDTLASRNNLAAVRHALGKLSDAEAETEYRAVLRACVTVLGDGHPTTLASRNNLAVILRTQGRPAEAETEFSAVLQARVAALGPDHPESLASRNNLAAVRHALGKLSDADAETEFSAVLQARVAALGPDHPETLISRNNLAAVRHALGKLSDAEAETEYRAILDARTRLLGPDHPHTVVSRANLTSLLKGDRPRELRTGNSGRSRAPPTRARTERCHPRGCVPLRHAIR